MASRTASRKQDKFTARTADKHQLYEMSVQNPEVEIKFINRVFKKKYGHYPFLLREDFCGTALLCAEWVRSRGTNKAIGVDLDQQTLEWGQTHNISPLGARAEHVTLIKDDVRNVTKPRCDVLAATNFSWWGFKTREKLAGYFNNVYACLRAEGMLMLDIYGGPEAQVPQLEEREQEGFDYVWDQDHFNPITQEIRCMIHFQFPDGTRMKNAFRYDWRLWNIAETRDLLAECGFKSTVVYWELADSDGEPSGIFRPSQTGDLAPAWVAYILAFK